MHQPAFVPLASLPAPTSEMEATSEIMGGAASKLKSRLGRVADCDERWGWDRCRTSRSRGALPAVHISS